jgi:hypothetical protein
MRASSLRTPIVAALVAGGTLLTTAPAIAQSSVCQEGQKLMSERQTLTEQLNNSAGKDKKLDPKVACSAFGKLGTNSDAIVKWMETNKDWCQIPDQVLANFKSEQAKVKELRGHACKVAAQATQMEKQAREGAGNPFGGGLTGQYKIPQGAL